jgi:protein ImuB
MLNARAQDVVVTAEALLSDTPHALGWGRHRYRVAAWAGPWPVDTGWWGPDAQRVARLQVVGQAENERHPRAWLLLWLSGGGWRIEAGY